MRAYHLETRLEDWIGKSSADWGQKIKAPRSLDLAWDGPTGLLHYAGALKRITLANTEGRRYIDCLVGSMLANVRVLTLQRLTRLYSWGNYPI